VKVLNWLLQSDVSIQYLAQSDLLSVLFEKLKSLKKDAHANCLT